MDCCRRWCLGLVLLAGSVGGVGAMPSSPAPDLICYLQLEGDRLINLSALCRSPQAAPRRVVVTEIRIEGDRVVGRVRNDTGQTLQRVIVNYEMVGSNTSRYREFGFVEPEQLQPGQTGTFRGGLTRPGTPQVTQVEWW